MSAATRWSLQNTSTEYPRTLEPCSHLWPLPEVHEVPRRSTTSVSQEKLLPNSSVQVFSPLTTCVSPLRPSLSEKPLPLTRIAHLIVKSRAAPAMLLARSIV